MIRKTTRGFTLIELMIAVVIMGILASVAYSSYQGQVMRSNRSDATAALNDASQRLQRCFTLYNNYTHEDCQVHDDLQGGGIQSSEGMYRVEYESAPSATGYTLVARAINAPQTGDTDCTGANAMTLTQTGRREPQACW